MKRAAWTFVGAALIAGACERPGNSGTGWLAGSGDPVNLALTFNGANGAAKVITPSGGSISVTTADGTRFRLDIPEGALASDERISMIPVTTIKGLPIKKGGDFTAVHLKPDGLRLLKAAKLHIRPKTEIAVPEQIAFGYYGNGRDAHLYPMSTDPSVIELPIFHFSGYGYGRAAPGDPGRIVLQQAAEKEARLTAKLADLMSRERGAQLKGAADNAGSISDVESLMLQYYREVVRPLMQIAENDDRMASCAISCFQTWSRQALHFGLMGDDSSEIEQAYREGQASYIKIVENKLVKHTERIIKQCREDQNFDAVNELIALERDVQLRGWSDKHSRLQQALEEVEKCFNFEVEFRSVMYGKTPSGELYYDVGSKVEWQDGLLVRAPTTGKIDYLTFRASGDPAKDILGNQENSMLGMLLENAGPISAAGTKPSTFTVHRVGWNMNRIQVEGTNCKGQDDQVKDKVAEDFFVIFSPGTPTELVRTTPRKAGQQSTFGKMYEGIGEVMEGTNRNGMCPECAAKGKEAKAAGRSSRILGPTTEAEHGWLEKWKDNHSEELYRAATDSVALAETNDAEPPAIYKINLKPVGKGVWRAEYKVKDPGAFGFSSGEDSYVIVRHAPKK